MIVELDTDAEGETVLELASSLGRARVLMEQGVSEGIDAYAVRDTVEGALNAMESVRRVKSQLTGAKTSIDAARDLIDTIAQQVRGHLHHVNELVVVAGAETDEPVAPAEPDQPSLV